MPQLPTPATNGQDVWGTQLNSFLTTAHDDTVANGGKVKPSGILAGTTGQVLTTTASGPAWASATTNARAYDMFGANFQVISYSPTPPNGTLNAQKLAISSTDFNNPAGFPYLFGYGFGVSVTNDMAGLSGEIRGSLFIKPKTNSWTGGSGIIATGGTSVFRLGAGFSIWVAGAYAYQEIVPNIPLPLDLTNADLRVEVIASNTISGSTTGAQLIWWNGQ